MCTESENMLLEMHPSKIVSKELV